MLQFDASFENKATSVETVTSVLESGVWRVVGHFIRWSERTGMGLVDEPQPVAAWARVLAWVIVASSAPAAIGAVLELSRRSLSDVSWWLVAPFVLSAAWGLPLFFIVAFTGRAPRHWWGLGTHLWRRGDRHAEDP